MSSRYGTNLSLTIFGQSHSPAIGMTLEGIPAGEKIDMEALSAFLKRRAPGQNGYSTPRKEADIPEFLSGLKDDTTCGAPLTAIIRNTNTRSGDYDELKRIPRPGHADLTASVKYGGFQDHAGGGHFSGRLTAPLCVAGGILLQLLEKKGIRVMTRISSIGGINDEGALTSPTSGKDFPAVSDEKGEAMKAAIRAAKEHGDSLGGVIECVITGVPAGLGDPIFDGLENRLASVLFGIPAVKGLEFGDGFALAEMKGSEANDPFIIRDGEVMTETNHCGGILGGISDGMPVTFRVAIKPTPSIASEQRSICLDTKEETTLAVKGRHDPCIVPRAVPCVEAAAAVALYDAVLQRKKERCAR